MNHFNLPASPSKAIPAPGSHLTEDQFADCALGLDPVPETASHLTQCAACREELASFGASVASFNTASLAWSESRPASSLIPASRARGQRPFFNAASWALAGCTLLIVGASTVLHRQETQRTATVASAGASQEDSEAEIAQDNKLLLEVDQALRHNISSPVQEYGLASATNPHGRPHGDARIQ